MKQFNLKKFEKYLSSLYGGKVKILSFEGLGKKVKRKKQLKEFGYGKPYFLTFTIKGRKYSTVFQTMKPDSFGHENVWDRAQNIIFAYLTYNKLPKHAKSLDAGIITKDGNFRSLSNLQEFFILVERVKGREYFHDLEEIVKKGSLEELDLERCKALSHYLAKIHSRRKNAPSLYVRRIRELIGHGECIMGLLDNYPEKLDFTSWDELLKIEKLCVDWRWKIKRKTYRLCQVHGDFHPWNILFQEGVKFRVLDRSRGEWGEAADDLSSLTINYLFFPLQAFGKVNEPFKTLFRIFIEEYLRKTGDEEVLKVIQPFYAWRGLVLANPIWYPTLTFEVRRKILNFILNVLSSDEFDFKNVESYFTS